MQTKVGITMLQNLAVSQSPAPFPQVRVQLQLNSQQTFRFIHGHQVHTQSHLCSAQ